MLEERICPEVLLFHYYTSTRQLVFCLCLVLVDYLVPATSILAPIFFFSFHHWLAATARVLTPVHGVFILLYGTKSLRISHFQFFILFCAAALFVALSREYVSVTNTATAGKRWPLRILGPPPRSLFTRPFCRFRFCYVRNYPFVTANYIQF